MEYLIAIFIGIISGVLASYLFVKFYIQQNVPVIELSPCISFINHNGKDVYMFKFVNKTDVPIFDVKLELTLMESVGAVDGRDLVSKDLYLEDDFLSYIPNKKATDTHSLHAFRVYTKTDINTEWSNNTSFLRLTIMAKHSLTGLNKVVFQDYNHKDCINNKPFEQGDNLKTIS